MKKLIIPIFIPFVGCPERCVYCDQESITGKKAQIPTITEIEATIREYLSYSKNKENIEVAVYGGTFTALSIEDQEALLKNIRNNSVKKPASLRISTHPAYVDLKSIEMLRKYDVETVELGVQSMDSNVLKLLRRDYSAKTVIEAMKLLRKHSFQVGAQLMIGCPGERMDSYIAGINSLIENGFDFFRIYPLKLFPGTALHTLVTNEKVYLPPEKETLALLEKSLVLFELNNKPVIRVGLPENSAGSREGAAIPDLEHPALRFKVMSSIALKVLTFILEKFQDLQSAEFKIPAKKMSEYTGHKNQNREALKDIFNLQNLAFKCDNNTNFDLIEVVTETECFSFSRKDILKSIYFTKNVIAA